MSIVRAIDLLDQLRVFAAALPLEETGNTEPLFERVEIYANKDLGAALAELVITKQRVLLIVPTGIRRDREPSGGGQVLVKRHLLCDLLVSDRSYFRAGQRAIAGGDKNIGTLEMVERFEAALEGYELTPYGECQLQDSTPLELTAADKTTREAWIQTLTIPAGDIRTATF